MKLGDKVKWITASGVHGSGIILPLGTNEDLHAFVAVDAPLGEEHRVIYCTKTWLTVI